MRKIYTYLISSFFLVLIIIAYFYSQEKNNKRWNLNLIQKCNLITKSFIWDKKYKKANLKKLIYKNMIGSMQGVYFNKKNKLIYTVNSSLRQNINAYNHINGERIYNNSFSINAANLIIINEKDKQKILVTDYNKPYILFLDNKLNKIDEILLPKEFNYIVSITSIDDRFIIIPSRSKNLIGILDLKNNKKFRKLKTRINKKYAIYDLEYSDGCFFLNYREKNEILLGYINNKREFQTKSLNIFLKYPQGMWFENNKLYIIETGKNSLHIFDFLKKTQNIYILPKGVYKSISKIDTDNLIVSGHVFSKDENNNVSTMVSNNLKETILHHVKLNK